MIGFICVNKKVGDTSAFCVNKIKRLLGAKCGHMGTLDPLASGVLPVGIGQATRLFDFLLDKKKTYIANFDFAYETPSLDLETEKENLSPYIPTKEQIKAVLPEFIGEIMQVPPVYSAKFVDGKRSYKLARKGTAVELPPKKIVIDNIEILEKLSDSEYSFKIDCEGGTYIRSIVRDIAHRLGVYGTMTKLVRVSSGVFNMENSVTLEELCASNDVMRYLVKPEDVISFEKLILDAESAKRLLDGLYDDFDLKNGLYRVYNQTEFWGVGEITDKKLKMRAFVRDL